MATKHPRINVLLEEQYVNVLSMLATRQQQSISAAARDLILEALERHEDLFLSELAARRDKDGASYISHEDYCSSPPESKRLSYNISH